MEPVHEGGEALVSLAQPPPALEHGKIDAGIEIEQEPPELCLPGGGIEVAQGFFSPEAGPYIGYGGWRPQVSCRQARFQRGCLSICSYHTYSIAPAKANGQGRNGE